MSILSPLKIGIVGTGQLGASLGMSMMDAGIAKDVLLFDIHPETAKTALKAGAGSLIATTPQELIDNTDVLLLCCSMHASMEWFKLVEKHATTRHLISDVGSAKHALITAAEASMPSHSYLPAHPIAGDDRTGAEAANLNLFRNRKLYLTPVTEQLVDTATICRIWEAAGARIEVLDPLKHDQVFAATSHLQHLLAFAYLAMMQPSPPVLKKPLEPVFQQFLRLSGASPGTWADVLHYNREAIQTSARHTIAATHDLLASMQADDGGIAFLTSIHQWRRDARRMLRPEQWMEHSLKNPYLAPEYRILPVMVAYASANSIMRLEDAMDEGLYGYLGEGFFSFSTPALTQPEQVAELMLNTPVTECMKRFITQLEALLALLADRAALLAELEKLQNFRQQWYPTMIFEA